MLSDVDIDKFVGNNRHFLQFKSLHSGAREPLNDPTELLLLVLLDLGAHKVDNNLIVD